MFNVPILPKYAIMGVKKGNRAKTFADKVIAILSKAGFTVFPNLPIVEGNLPFLAATFNETLILGEILPLYWNEKDLEGIVVKLLAVRTALTNLFIETLEDVRINISMVIICERKAEVMEQMQDAALFYSDIKLISFKKNSKEILKFLPDISSDLLKNKESDEDYKAYIEYIESIIGYFTQNSVLLGRARLEGFVANTNKNKTFQQEFHFPFSENQKHYNSPSELANEVKKYVKGQDEVIERIAIPFFQHIESRRLGISCDIKTSFLLAGATGTGKSEILRRFAQISGVPIVRINTADCVPNSWKGEHISDLVGYYINDEADLEEMKYAVLVFNEFDKITHYNQRFISNNGSEWDLDMQRDFLKFFDKDYELVIEKQKQLEILKFRLPTNNLLLCFDGAFSGIEKIIEKRLNLCKPIGFSQSEKSPLKTDGYSSLLQQLVISDLQKWGYIPELLGRIGLVYTMNPMTEELIYEIITTASENILQAHKTQCSNFGIELRFTEDTLREIAKMAIKTEIGFRSVKTLLANLMEDVYFNCDKYKNTTLTIDKEFIALMHFRNEHRSLIKDYKQVEQGKMKVKHLLEKHHYTPKEYSQKLKYLEQL